MRSLLKNKTVGFIDVAPDLQPFMENSRFQTIPEMIMLQYKLLQYKWHKGGQELPRNTLNRQRAGHDHGRCS